MSAAEIIGGGIGGIAAAIALSRAGRAVTVYEQADTIEEVGAGLQISANGQRALEMLGAPLRDDSLAFAAKGGTVLLNGLTGGRITRFPAPSAGATRYMHRADLLAHLLAVAQDLGVDIKLGARKSVDDCAAPLVIAADGAQSSARVRLDGTANSSFTHQVAWRALVPGDPADLTDYATLSMAPGKHVVTYPLRNGELINIVAVEERGDWRDESWRQREDPVAFQRRFASLRGPVPGLLERVEDVHIWALHLRPVAQKWQDGRVALLGDAAHATLPFLAQGACAALEDAAVLGKLIADHPQAEALSRYEALRRKRTARIVQASARNRNLFHLSGPARWGFNLTLRLSGRAMAGRLNWIYDYDPHRRM